MEDRTPLRWWARELAWWGWVGALGLMLLGSSLVVLAEMLDGRAPLWTLPAGTTFWALYGVLLWIGVRGRTGRVRPPAVEGPRGQVSWRPWAPLLGALLLSLVFPIGSMGSFAWLVAAPLGYALATLGRTVREPGALEDRGRLLGLWWAQVAGRRVWQRREPVDTVLPEVGARVEPDGFVLGLVPREVDRGDLLLAGGGLGALVLWTSMFIELVWREFFGRPVEVWNMLEGLEMLVAGSWILAGALFFGLQVVQRLEAGGWVDEVRLRGRVLETSDGRTFHLENPGRRTELQTGPFGSRLVLANDTERVVLRGRWRELAWLEARLHERPAEEAEGPELQRLRAVRALSEASPAG